jgi:O-antigen/teichoic acid export membrane protein
MKPSEPPLQVTAFRARKGILIGRLPRGGFARNVTVIAASTAVGQTISALALLALTRLYSPSELGSWGVYLAILIVLVVPSSLRYEVAIPLPKTDVDAAGVVALSTVILLGTTVLLASVLWFANAVLNTHLWLSSIGAGFWILPFAFFALGLYQILNFWSVRRTRFGLIAAASISQSVWQAIAQVMLGLVGLGRVGLMAGDLCGRGAGTAVFSVREFAELRRLISNPKRPPLRQLARRYRRFPLLSSWSGVLNVLGLQLPFLLIAAEFGPATVGYFALAQRLLIAPVTLVSSSVSQVFIAEAARLAREDYQGLSILVKRLTKKLALWAFPPAIGVFLLAPSIFRIAFGSEWVVAGEFARWLVPAVLAQFVLSAVAPVMNIVERQDLQLLWDVARLIVVATVLILAGTLGGSLQAVAAFSLALTILYAFLFVGYLRVLSRPRPRLA